MPRQRVDYSIQPYNFPQDHHGRLKRFQEQSGPSWSEIARRSGTYRYTVWCWQEGRGRPNMEHMIAGPA